MAMSTRLLGPFFRVVVGHQEYERLDGIHSQIDILGVLGVRSASVQNVHLDEALDTGTPVSGHVSQIGIHGILLLQNLQYDFTYTGFGHVITFLLKPSINFFGNLRMAFQQIVAGACLGSKPSVDSHILQIDLANKFTLIAPKKLFDVIPLANVRDKVNERGEGLVGYGPIGSPCRVSYLNGNRSMVVGAARRTP